MTQSPAALYTLLQVDVHQSQSQTSPSFLECTQILIGASRQFLLKYSPVVLALGQPHHSSESWKRKEIAGEEAHKDTTIFGHQHSAVSDHYNYNFPDLKNFPNFSWPKKLSHFYMEWENFIFSTLPVEREKSAWEEEKTGHIKQKWNVVLLSYIMWEHTSSLVPSSDPIIQINILSQCRKSYL